MKSKSKLNLKGLKKTPTGIFGFDEITNGGLPKGRPTLVCGSAGCGKTIFATEFLVRGATQFNEPGVYMMFEETEKELITNVASLGFDLEYLINKRMILLDYVKVERSEIEETGEYDLEALIIRLNYAIDKIKAKRVVLDTIESLFAGLKNPFILRAELRRLFRWLKDKGVTSIITGESGEGTFTRQGLEEYVSDCVIFLNHLVKEQISTRRLRVVKYRGSSHGTNEYPFLIDENGISVLPITSLKLEHTASYERVSSGVEFLDSMLSGKGFYRGTTILFSGTAGTGKSSFAAYFADAACKRNEKVLYVALEESPEQICRNMSSIGLNFDKNIKKGLLKFFANRSTFFGLESYLTSMIKEVNNYKPDNVIIDPVSSFIIGTNHFESKAMLMRFVDFLKLKGITLIMTNLTLSGESIEHTEIDISSLIDSWILLRIKEVEGERKRDLYILKSRGMEHSNKVFSYRLCSSGILPEK